MRSALGPGSGVLVESAGLQARVGEPMVPEMARLLAVPRQTVRARQFVPEAARGAGLVLTMTRAHRAAVVTAAPAALRRTFTLREFSDLAQLLRTTGEVPQGPSAAARLAALVALAPRLRSRRAPGPDDDVEDPYGQDSAAYARALGILERSVATIGDALAS